MRKICALFFILISINAHAQLKQVKVIKVIDAQVLTVFADEIGEELTMIIAGMACPGTDQPYGNEAKVYVTKLLQGKTLRVKLLDSGKDGLIGLIYDTQGNCLTDELIKRGLAQADERETQWVALEAEARKKKLGIWKDGKTIDLEKDWAEHHLKNVVRKEK